MHDGIDVASEVSCVVNQDEQVDFAIGLGIASGARSVQNDAAVSIPKCIAQAARNLAAEKIEIGLHWARVYGGGHSQE